MCKLRLLHRAVRGGGGAQQRPYQHSSVHPAILYRSDFEYGRMIYSHNRDYYRHDMPMHSAERHYQP